MGKSIDGYYEEFLCNLLAEKKGYAPHKCRHSLTSLLIQQGVDILIVSQILGHEDLSSTTIYAHTTTSHMREEMCKFPVTMKPESE